MIIGHDHVQGCARVVPKIRQRRCAHRVEGIEHGLLVLDVRIRIDVLSDGVLHLQKLDVGRGEIQAARGTRRRFEGNRIGPRRLVLEGIRKPGVTPSLFTPTVATSATEMKAPRRRLARAARKASTADPCAGTRSRAEASLLLLVEETVAACASR